MHYSDLSCLYATLALGVELSVFKALDKLFRLDPYRSSSGVFILGVSKNVYTF